MPREGGKIKTYMFVIFLLQWEMMQINPGLISAHFGKMKVGADFQEFLGEDEYEKHIIAMFNDFLHNSFSTC